MGVRAVVAAGWEVDDDAAQTFAQTFYDRMLSGASFGEAVFRARKAAFDNHPLVNTWGAYQ
jgi:CHAT domain-containing protein